MSPNASSHCGMAAKVTRDNQHLGMESSSGQLEELGT